MHCAILARAAVLRRRANLLRRPSETNQSDPAAMPRMHAAASVAAVLLVTFGEGLASARNVHGEGQHSMHEVVDVLNFEGANVCSLDTTPCATLGVVTTMNKCVDGSS